MKKINLKSHTAANSIQIIARLNSPSIANLIELNPKLKPDNVIKFGNSDFKFIFFIAYFSVARTLSPAITLSPTLQFTVASNGI